MGRKDGKSEKRVKGKSGGTSLSGAQNMDDSVTFEEADSDPKSTLTCVWWAFARVMNISASDLYKQTVLPKGVVWDDSKTVPPLAKKAGMTLRLPPRYYKDIAADKAFLNGNDVVLIFRTAGTALPTDFLAKLAAQTENDVATKVYAEESIEMHAIFRRVHEVKGVSAAPWYQWANGSTNDLVQNPLCFTYTKPTKT